MKDVLRVFSAAALMVLFHSVTVGVEPAKYPLRVFILKDRFNRTTTTYGTGLRTQVANGEGKGNLQDGDVVRGFDYTYSCDDFVDGSTGDPLNPLTGYQARWKKEGTRLALLIVEIGNPKHQTECELKTNLVDVIYSMSQGQVIALTREQYDDTVAWRKAFAAMTHPADTDSAHFPLAVTMLEAQWQDHPGGGVTGGGRGDVVRGDSISAITLVAPRCAGRFNAGSAYPAKWLEEPTRLLVLAHTVGGASGEGFMQCEFQANLQPNNVFVKNNSTGAILTLTQDQNKARLQAAKAAQQGSTPGGAKSTAGPAASANQKLSVVSNPDGADIEVDGAFVGSTPSVVELSPGEHTVVIRKRGYQSWERKLRVAGGDIKLNADLEKLPEGQ